MKPTKKGFALVVILSFCFYIILFFPIFSWAACTGSSPYWSTTADYTSVNACISGAAAGDTIIVTGNATWTNTLTITRGVNLIGSGSPIITGKIPTIYWTPSDAAQSAHDTLKIQGFVFDANNAIGASGIITVNSGSVNYVNLVVMHNTLKNTTSRGIYLWGSVWGVASTNTFDRVGVPLTVGNGDYAGWQNWSQAYGSASAFYFEDNTIQYSSVTAATGFMESGDGAQWVVRYNTWNQTNATMDSLWDIHGLQTMAVTSGFTCPSGCGYDSCTPTSVGSCNESQKTCQQYSTLNSEFYGNKIINMTAQRLWMGQRGGWMLMFNNTYGTSSADTWISYGQYSCDDCAVQGSYTQHISNTYLWNNFSNTTRVGMLKGSDFCADKSVGKPYTITENRDYYNFTTGFDGTAGVGAGPLASRSATCTPGVAYWATTQSTTDLTGMVGANPATPISGTLYKCTAANTWTAYYTPYTYPHPQTAPFPRGTCG